jgi:hypothetical protein
VVTFTLVVVELLTSMVEVVTGDSVEDVEGWDSELVVVFFDPPPPCPPLEGMVVVAGRTLVVFITLEVVLAWLVVVLNSLVVVVPG